MNDKPDLLEKVVRFVCGTVAGLFFWVIYSVQFEQVHDSLLRFLVMLVIFVALFGFLAMKFGDKFWEKLFKFPWT